MCPDRQIFSVYYDQELPSPWKEKMEAHLAVCPECRAKLAELGKVSAVLREEPVYRAGYSPEEAEARVWNVLVSRSGKAAGPGPVTYRKLSPRIWRRSVTVPLSAVVAAAALVVSAFTFALANRPAGSDRIPDTAISADMDIDRYSTMSVANMNDVLRYLGQDDSGTDFMIIRLPETKRFTSNGEPAIIRAADYSRRAGNQ
jgi:hypothetical protein